MQYNVVTTKRFEKDIKQYNKKFRHVAFDVNEVINKLKNGELVGEVIPNIEMADDNNVAIKVRVANSDTKAGTQNGYRLIYYAIKEDGTIVLLTLYYKKEKANITNKEIQELILKYCL